MKKPSGSSSESTSEEDINEIFPPSAVSTEKPTRQPTRVTTPVAATVQRPTPIAITQRPAVTKPVAVTQRPTKPIVVTRPPTLTTLRPPFPATVSNTSTVQQRDFVCQVGKGSCRAAFRGAPWIFRAQPSSFINPSIHISGLSVVMVVVCCAHVPSQDNKES